MILNDFLIFTFNYGSPVNHFQFNNHHIQELRHQRKNSRMLLNGSDVFGALLTYQSAKLLIMQQINYIPAIQVMYAKQTRPLYQMQSVLTQICFLTTFVANTISMIQGSFLQYMMLQMCTFIWGFRQLTLCTPNYNKVGNVYYSLLAIVLVLCQEPMHQNHSRICIAGWIPKC